MDIYRIKYLLNLISKRSNWSFDTEYGRYGEWIWISEWVGDEDIWDMAAELLEEIEE